VVVFFWGGVKMGGWFEDVGVNGGWDYF